MHKKEKKFLPAICNLIGILMILAVLAIGVPLTIPELLGYAAYNVESGSMEPALPMGSVVYVFPKNAADVNSGDIITFHRGDTVITHRVLENHVIEGEFLTMGDANETADPATVPYSDYIGRVEYHLPFIGRLLVILSGTVGKIYVLIFAACGVMLNILASRIRKVRKNRLQVQLQDEDDFRSSITTEDLEEAVHLKRRGTRIRRVLMIVFLSIFILAAGGVFYIMWQYRLSDDLYATAANSFVEVTYASPNSEVQEYSYNEYYYVEETDDTYVGDDNYEIIRIPESYELIKVGEGEQMVVTPEGDTITMEDLEHSNTLNQRRFVINPLYEGYQVIETYESDQTILTPNGEEIPVTFDDSAPVGNTDDSAPDPDSTETTDTTDITDGTQSFDNSYFLDILHVPEGYQPVMTDDGGLAIVTPNWEQIGISVSVVEPPTRKLKKFRREFAPIRVNFDELLEVNDDVLGWIYCKDSEINYPVLHGETNDTYLRHTYDGSYNVAGSIFIDESNDPELKEDVNTIIYGHHMQNGSMFATLEHWADQEFYENHSEMWLLTPTQDYKIVLFAGYHTSAYSDTYLVFRDYGEAFADYLEQAVKQSDFKTETQLKENAHYVVLSTCAYIFDNARYVIHGMLIPADSAGGKPIRGSRSSITEIEK